MKTLIIEFMLTAGVTILRITENEYTEIAEQRYSWWVAHSFTPSSTQGVDSIDFNEVQGIEITDFVNSRHHELDKTKLVADFQTYIEGKAENTIMQFSHTVKWKKYVQ